MGQQGGSHRCNVGSCKVPFLLRHSSSSGASSSISGSEEALVQWVGSLPRGFQGTPNSKELSPPHFPQGPVAGSSLGGEPAAVSHQGHKAIMPWLQIKGSLGTLGRRGAECVVMSSTQA